MGGVCPSRAQPRVPRAGWYEDGPKNWVYVKPIVEISDGQPNGLRATGRIAPDGRMEVRFSHNADRLRRGEVQSNGDDLCLGWLIGSVEVRV